ncbi:uncharacterized protein A1O5_08389 [Cladophialophora psammophila CBS 110553]|uniref:Uncharacterized protein n=1 Tax=Cladophialophora psammophila CBS 110553 TaxID=1182543 RepID=W9WU77_9EURO|nr:uncharacterized protein A1O5_08389 [Cladophialophora psammophila CBS 110553]EXJ68595.1 hypothetical protein A1O5_08389 [Cladophialophora psammophila CBS 110553]
MASIHPGSVAAFDPDNEIATKPQRPPSLDVSLNSLLGHLESVDKILVYAFGAFDRYYICWQDRHGEYRQERHGLPCALDEWLFPPDGTSRDLETLQVSLGHNDEFFAFDRYERISHINTNLRENVNSSSIHHKSVPQAGADMVDQRMAFRRKSHTFSHPEDNSSREDDQQQRLSMQQRRQGLKKRIRPRSIAIAGVLSLRASHERDKSHQDPALKEAWPDVSSMNQRRQPMLPLRRRVTYSDAGVQTDPVQDGHREAAEDTAFHNMASPKPKRSCVSSISSFSSLLSDSSSETVDSAISLSSTSSSAYYYSKNPISMGAMNRYFRESQYRLGDALIRAPPAGIGAH